VLYRIRNGLVAIPAAAYLEPVPICTRRFETRYVQIQCNTVRPSFHVQSGCGTGGVGTVPTGSIPTGIVPTGTVPTGSIPVWHYPTYAII